MGLRKLKKRKYLKMFGGYFDGNHRTAYYKNWCKWLKSKLPKVNKNCTVYAD